jgi:aromatic ring-cleaving dioxygenase
MVILFVYHIQINWIEKEKKGLSILFDPKKKDAENFFINKFFLNMV